MHNKAGASAMLAKSWCCAGSSAAACCDTRGVMSETWALYHFAAGHMSVLRLIGDGFLDFSHASALLLTPSSINF